MLKIFLIFSLLKFGFSGHTVFPNVYDGMRDRRQYPFVMKSTYFFVFLLYAGIASLGYLMYGANTNDEIILNLDRKLYPTKIILWLTIVVPFTKAALIINPGNEGFHISCFIDARSHA